MSYFTLTIPENVREKYRSKKAMRELSRKVIEMFKDYGYIRGLLRWHWFGDSGKKWHPHINVLVDGGYVKEKELESIKADYAKILGVDVAVLNHKYKRSPIEMAECLRYVTRATFLDSDWDYVMAHEIYNFRNMVVWGKFEWNGDDKWALPGKARVDRDSGEIIDVKAIELILNKIDPETGEKLRYVGVLPYRLLELVDKKSYGAGYYRIVDRAPPGRLDDKVKSGLRTMQLVKYIKEVYGAVVDDGSG
jgi:hypothetical protein